MGLDVIGLPSSDFVVSNDLVVRDANGTVRIRLDHETGSIFVHNALGAITFQLEMPGGNLRLGGHNQDGDIVIFSRNATNLLDDSQATFHLNSDSGVIRVGGNPIAGRLICLDSEDNQTIFLNGTEGNVHIGANGQDGNLILQNGANEVVLSFDAAGGSARLGGSGQGGNLQIQNDNGTTSIRLSGTGGTDGSHAFIRGGGQGSNGNILLFARGADVLNDSNEAAFDVSAASGSLTIGGGADQVSGDIFVRTGNLGPVVEIRGNDSSIRAGGTSNGGELLLFRSTHGPSFAPSEATMALNAESGRIRVGGGLAGANVGSVDGSVSVRNASNLETVLVEGGEANIFAGGFGADGDLVLQPAISNDLEDTEQGTIHLSAGEANVRVGGGVHGIAGDILVRNSSNDTTIHLDGEAGDIVLHNADGAEDFETVLGIEASPGTVMVLNADGQLMPSAGPYDKRVAGIVAGAGDLRPGIVLGRRSGAPSGVPIALFGRTYCMVDASYAQISVGDLLTTSPTPGMAMKAMDPGAAFGATVGKALKPLASGTGLIPVLVALQ